MPKNTTNQEQSSTTEKDMVKKIRKKEKKRNKYNAMQILNSFLKDSAPKTKESLKNVSKFSWCDLGRDCIKRKIQVNVERITEMEIAKWKNGISTFNANYNFVYSTIKRLDVQKVSGKETKKETTDCKIWFVEKKKF